MNIFTKAYFFALIGYVRMTWGRHDSHYVFRLAENPKFMGARDAAKLIPDGAVVATSGLAANQRPLILYWAAREIFEETGHPRDLTVICTGGQGGRGVAPGTLDEWGRPGLCTRLITAHVETFKNMLRMAEQGKMEIQCLPQGQLAQLIEGQGAGKDSVVTRVGVDTFLDPRTGRGTPLTGDGAKQLVVAEGDYLRYTIPKIDVAIFNAYAADREGNIYITHCPMKAEMREITNAAKKNGGRVIVNVSRLVEKDYDDVYIPAESVDAIVVYPKTEQTCYIPYERHFSFLTPKTPFSLEEGLERARFVNWVMGLTPVRTEMDQIVARLAAEIFVRNVSRGALVNIGVGMPEEVCRMLYENKILDHITLFTESGVFGGIPAPGIFFGSAVGLTEIIPSAETFRMCAEKLDVSVLGALQVDSDGNVNVSKRTDKLFNYVGPGGFIDLTTAAKTIIFITKWMEGAKMSVSGNSVRIDKPGKAKCVDKVDEVTFNGQAALKAGKKVFYVTTVGAFQLTQRGMELIRVMPGIDIQRDIVSSTTMKVALPEGGKVPVMEDSIVTGKGFRLSLEEGIV